MENQLQQKIRQRMEMEIFYKVGFVLYKHSIFLCFTVTGCVPKYDGKFDQKFG